MKNLRKIAVVVLALVMAFGLMACGGGEEQSVTYRMVQEQSGITITDEVTLEAKGDIVQRMVEKVVVDTSTLDDTLKAEINTIYDELVGMYQAVEGVECTGNADDNSYTIDIVIDATGTAVEELSEQGLLQMEGNADGISLEGSMAAFEANGYTLVE